MIDWLIDWLIDCIPWFSIWIRIKLTYLPRSIKYENLPCLLLVNKCRPHFPRKTLFLPLLSKSTYARNILYTKRSTHLWQVNEGTICGMIFLRIKIWVKKIPYWRYSSKFDPFQCLVWWGLATPQGQTP